jgi:hypothetical protein
MRATAVSHGGCANPTTYTICLAVILLVAVVFTLRDSCTRYQKEPVYIAAPVSVETERKHEGDARATPRSDECSYEDWVYPSWPKGFQVNVEAAFIVGADLGMMVVCCFESPRRRLELHPRCLHRCPHHRETVAPRLDTYCLR